jgi:hypothetical protein
MDTKHTLPLLQQLSRVREWRRKCGARFIKRNFVAAIKGVPLALWIYTTKLLDAERNMAAIMCIGRREFNNFDRTHH